MIRIPMSRGLYAQVDDVDAALLDYTWSYADGYAVRYEPTAPGKHLYLHRIVLAQKLGRDIAPELVAHHVNGDTLDDRRENLQEMTHAENMRHRRYGRYRILPEPLPARTVRSGVKGVYPARNGGWVGQVYYERQTYTTKVFPTIEEAEQARKQFHTALVNGTYTKESRQQEKIQERERKKAAREIERRREKEARIPHRKRRQAYQRYDKGLAETVTVLPLTQGRETLIDAADADLDQYCWWVGSGGYAHRRKYPGVSHTLHRVVLERKLGRPLTGGMWVDHINNNRLDNRRSNLREVTPAQNAQNKGRRSDNTHGYTGIRYHKEEDVWSALVYGGRQGGYVGQYATKEEAAAAYDQAVLELFGEFAHTNNDLFQMTLWGYEYHKWERSREAVAAQTLAKKKAKRKIAIESIIVTPTSRNTHGYKGVRQDGTRWRAEICYNYKKINLGRYGTPEEASRVYQDAKRKLLMGETVQSKSRRKLG